MSRPTLDTLLSRCQAQGVTVTWTHLPPGWEGAWHRSSRTIHLAPRLADWQAIPVLLHEMTHAHLDHDGHQAAAVERRIDEAVARTLLDHQQVALAEAAVGHHPGALATELDVPVWVIEAWRRTLRR